MDYSHTHHEYINYASFLNRQILLKKVIYYHDSGNLSLHDKKTASKIVLTITNIIL